jgi:hydrogenase maturation protein HypF
VAPAMSEVGVMVAYTPVHHLLFGLPGDAPGPRALVMTSGNVSGEPIVTDDRQSLDRLHGLADGWLMHDRPIAVPCDDSVLRVVDGEVMPIRRSRGYAPMPVALPFAVEPVLAVGGDLKNTCAVASGRYAWLSQHIGDMDDVATLDAFGRAAVHLGRLTAVTPRVLVADKHPGYRSTRWARMHAEGREVRTVQHHHAHVAAVMAEHGLDGERPVIGLAFDGTGYGTDAAVWGGEVLLTDYRGYRRFAHLAYVPLAGGDASVQRPYRMALAHLWAAGLDWSADLPPVRVCPPTELRVLEGQFRGTYGTVPTSSMGRLFDAVAALAGVRATVDYEAQAAIEFEAASDPPDASDSDSDSDRYRFAFRDHVGTLLADAAPVIRAVVADVRAGVPTGRISARFHAAVAALVVEFAQRARAQTGVDTVALTGGVFQNARLLSAGRRALRADGFDVITHRRVPPNDGGLALGQIMVGAALPGKPIREGIPSCV